VSNDAHAGWDHDGTATIEVAARDTRTALEAGLRAVLTLAVGTNGTTTESTGAAPIRGECDDLAGLFGELIEDLLVQIGFYGEGLSDVTIDGMLRGDRGGYRAWGYASGRLEPATGSEPPRLLEFPTALQDDAGQVTLRAKFRR
jgi:hypothetical protein